MTLATTTLGLLLLVAHPSTPALALQAQTNPPEQTTPAEEPKPAPPAETQPPQQATPKPPTPKKAVKKPVHKRPRSKSSKVVVKNGGATDPQAQISSTNDQQASQKIKDTNSLLGVTNENLQKISSQQLNPSQQDMVKQIHSYMKQSKTAADNGDVQGANNLAVKAHLLSEELVKH